MSRVESFARLSPAKQKLLLARLKKREEAGEIPESPRRAVEPVVFPLSFAQQRLWFLAQLEADAADYNITHALGLAGDLRVPLVAAALSRIVARHEALRTRFDAVDGRPVQTVLPPFELAVPLIDLAALPPWARAAEIERWGGRFHRLPFALARGPHLRAWLFRLAGGERPDHGLLFGMHHIVSDGWSVGILVRELSAFYPALLAGALPAGPPIEAVLPELPIQYPDFADWQRRHLAGERLASELAWWRGHLEGAPRVLELPADRPRPPVKRDRGRRLETTVPGAQGFFDRLSPEAGTTRFMLLLAGFGLLLGRLAGQDDLLIGSPVANRNRMETEGLIGFFVNTLVFRLSPGALPPAAGFAAWAAAVRRETLAVHAHQELPFERLVEELNPERDLGRSALFQVSCSLHDDGLVLELPGVEVRGLPLTAATALFDLDLDALFVGGDLVLDWSYSSDLFDEATIGRWARSFATLLTAAAADPARPWADLPLLAGGERHQLLAEWAGEEEDEPGPALLHAGFEMQAGRRPDAAAVASAQATLTYGELAARADRLAAALAQRGVGPEIRVGLALPRSAEMLTAMLAILKAGGAYVPLDLEAPAERLATLVADALAPCTPALLLAAPDARLPTFPGIERAAPSSFASVEPRGSLAPPAPGNAAYLIYTSGSTGAPKGVVVPHAAAASYVASTVRCYGMGPADRIPQAAAVTFDASLDEIFVPLAAGAAILLGPALSEDPWRFSASGAALGATVWSLPTAYWHQMAAAVEGGLAVPPEVRLLIAGGERALPERWFGWRAPGVELLNTYGPTEAVVGVAAGVRGDDPAEASRREVPIGRPLAGERLYVVDRGLRLVPAGVSGELVAGGGGLARGYLGRPDATARAFVPDPFGTEPGGRLYRTGDLTRHLPDGRLEVLGRIDAQVKIRGFRIELGEIEAALAAHPAVAEAAVVAAGDPASPRGLYLAAFVVPRPAPAAPAPSTPVADGELFARLYAHLGERLPESMIPAELYRADALPWTAHGKIDRAELVRRAALQASAASRRAGGGAPKGELEELLAGLWGELLDVARVARDDDFFALGGHSLLATQLIARVRRTFGVELPQRAVFEDSTLAAMAARLAAAQGTRGTAEGDEPPPRAFAHGAVPAGVAEAAAAGPPLSFAQERLWLIDQVEPGSNAYNMPVALRLSGPLDVAALAAAWSALAARHASLRTRFAAQGGEPFQRIEPAGPVPLPLFDLAGLPEVAREAEAARLADLAGRLPFDLARDPVLRVALLALGRGEHILLFTVHHIASDGWSNGVLVREMVALYGAGAAGAPSPLAALPLAYADYARWQRATVAGERLAAMMDFFRRELADLPHLELPTDRPRSGPATGGALAAVRLPPALAGHLTALGRRAGATLFMQLLAAFQAVLGRWSGQRDFAVGTPVAGRRFVELEGLIGFFVNTLVLRADLSGNPGGLALLERTRARALAVFAHQDLPFERLVTELNPERSLAYTPLFQVMCILQNAPDPPVRLETLAVAGLAPPAMTAKFDLTLSWTEADGGLDGVLEYRPELFDPATVLRLAGHVGAFLAELAAAPERPVDELPLLAAAERQAVLAEWNDTASAGEPPGLDEVLFGTAARAFEGAAPALVAGDLVLSRRELAGRTTTLARHLRGLGVGPGARVAICLPRSPEMVVAMLGTLAAGGAYVPLDPGYPEENLAFMLADSGAVVLLTDPGLAGRFVGFGGTVVEVGRALTPGPSPAAGEGDLLPEDGDFRGDGARSWPPSDELAYVCYTSGSTGRPKGVAMSRGALGNLLAWQAGELGDVARTLQFAPLSFDVSFQEIGSAWATGSALVLVDDETRRDGEALLAHLERHRVERLFLPFVALAYLAEAAAVRSSPPRLALRDVITAGEQLQVHRTVAAFFAGLPGCRLHNHYGPTETHAATALVLDGDPASWPLLPAVGRPLANGRTVLLDEAGLPVPRGAAGELCQGGAGLARGYLGRPDLTAARFVPDPWGPPGARLYKTGDRARHLPDGIVEYLGRTDDQVKIRGIRVEPGEVEAALGEQPEVGRAAVVAREAGGARILVAFYVAAEGAAPLAEELRARLAARLPPAFVPARFVALPELPLTPSGKVNRRALARLPLGDGEAPGAAYEPPRGEVEELLAGLWSELLGGIRVSRHDEFFALGGHSLMATRLASRLRERLGIDLPVAAVFEHRGLAALAAEVERRLAERAALGRGLDGLVDELAGISEDDLLALFAEGDLAEAGDEGDLAEAGDEESP